MKLWQKDTDSLKEVEKFTVGKDRELDVLLARYDVLGSLAHIQMLESIGLLTKEELSSLRAALKAIYKEIEKGNFSLEDGVEDIHSQIELLLTQQLGDAGKKIHAARSRNDQVLVDLKLYLRNELEEIIRLTERLFELFQQRSEEHKNDLLPGYTHFQLAMPSSFGLWFGAYAESLADDIASLYPAWLLVNKNPLGSAAGYGSSFPINRTLTTQLLGFSDLDHNVVYAQMGRGKVERIFLQGLSNIAATLAKCAMDGCVFMNQNFGFISFPDELTTGSSIMPHKKNPDVLELVRARCNQIQSAPAVIQSVISNLPSGYHRDFQLIKEIVFPVIGHLKDCIGMMHLMFSNVSIRKDILNDEKYLHLFTVEEMNKLVLQGTPLRDAYREIGMQVAEGTFRSSGELHHTHEGSAGNLHNEEIAKMLQKTLQLFNFDEVNLALKKLLQ
ncbi:MAG: argininosuccinate lyase [Chitinophagaceae bacterium]|nr:argininosuccinate lyase [Chitinophagaceae bacterium]